MKKSISIFSLLIAIFSICCCEKEPTREPAARSEWLPFDEGIELARNEKKPVVIDFYTSWCHWCKVMDKQTFSDPEVEEFLAMNFVTIRINAESTKENYKYKGREYNSIQLTRAFGVRGFPSLAYLDREGDLITVVPGFVPKDMFLPFLRYIKNECYKQQMTFKEFLKKKEECNEEE